MRECSRFSFLRALALGFLYGTFAGAGGVYFAIVEINRDLILEVGYQPDLASRVYSSDGELIGEYYLQKRVLVEFERIPRHVQQAFVSAEDQRFWDHPGFDIFGIVRAAWANYRHGSIRQGASTITQQVTRMLLLNNDTEKTLLRKAREVILAVRVERELSKRQILHRYLNHVYLGHGAYGVEAAADVYFGKSVEHLTVAEAAMLAGLVQAPSKYSPHHNIPAARRRQHYVLARMRHDGYISTAEFTAARSEPLALVAAERPLNEVAAPYFVEHIRRWAMDRFGAGSVLHGGLRIYTTLDMKMQRAAEAAVRAGLQELDRQIGFRRPLGHLEGEQLAAFVSGPPRPHAHGLEGMAVSGEASLLPDVAYVAAVVALPGASGIEVDLGPQTLALDAGDARRMRAWRDANGQRLMRGDLIPVQLSQDRRGRTVTQLAQVPDVQAAVLVLDQSTGSVEAMVGGYDYRQNQFNRATQARRQIGSAIKPFIYAAALQHGYTQLDVVRDGPVFVRTAAGVWSPTNYDLKYHGPVTLRTALAKSLNTVSVRLLLALGVERIVDLMGSFGITSPIPRHISIALGTPDLTLFEVTAAYATLANGGLRVSPRFVNMVTAADGQRLVDYRNRRPRERVISAELAYVVASMLEAVVERGTGRGTRALGRPTAGKTGTSTGHRDAWFMGFTADRIAGVWIGRDDFTPIGAEATGGTAALPIWLHLMRAAHPDTPPRPFPVPEDVFFVRADEFSGRPAPPGAHGARWIPFVRGSVPARFAATVRDRHFSAGPGFAR